ncbi:hypothetical protein KQX54_021807 [Cotesia glomerata]|uniref:Uncharacterized protein n=1 Tax=Cotesia glomerata TaxID=32391 RepID=A0AAV7J955_COTGL|nr:hypothetical protein KQX54_021807 [Cotesia glomerata]
MRFNGIAIAPRSFPSKAQNTSVCYLFSGVPYTKEILPRAAESRDSGGGGFEEETKNKEQLKGEERKERKEAGLFPCFAVGKDLS